MASLKYCEQVEHLGTDQIWEISSRMPAKSAIKLLSLSKSLSTIPSDPLFVERQSIHSSRFVGGFFLQPSGIPLLPPSVNPPELEFHVLSINSSTFGIPPDSLPFLQQNGPMLCSSQGLVVVLRTSDFRFLICNPATRSWALLPIHPDSNKLKSLSFKVLLEFHPRNLKTQSTAANNFPNDYTIIVVNYYTNAEPEDEDDDPEIGLTVYRNGKWEEDSLDLRIPERQISTLISPVGLFRGCNGGIVVHFLCARTERGCYNKDHTNLVAYDVDRKAFTRTFNLPEDTWKERERYMLLKIFKWRSSGDGDDTVSLVRVGLRKLRVWVLEDYEQGGWRRVVSITTTEIGVPEEEGSVRGCGVINGTELVFATERRVYVYQMEGPHAGRLEAVAEHRCQLALAVSFNLYANTLRPVC